MSHDFMMYHGGKGLFFTLLTMERRWHRLPDHILKLFYVIPVKESFLKKLAHRNHSPFIASPPLGINIDWSLSMIYIISFHITLLSILSWENFIYIMFDFFQINFVTSCLHLSWNRTIEQQFRWILQEDSCWSAIRRLACSGSRSERWIHQIFPARKDSHNLQVVYSFRSSKSNTSNRTIRGGVPVWESICLPSWRKK